MADTLELAKKAITWNWPFILSLVADGVTEEKCHLHVVVGQCTSTGGSSPQGQRSMGDSEDWGQPLDEIAYSLFEITCRTGRRASEVPLSDRKAGETKHSGSVIVDSVVAAVFGFQPELNEMIAGMIAATFRGLLRLEGLLLVGRPVEGIELDDFLPDGWPNQGAESSASSPA